MPDQKHQVVVCWPSDRTLIAKLNRVAVGHEAFVPTVEHSLSTCDGCGISVWIGNQQLQLVNGPFTAAAKKLCLICASAVTKTLKLTPNEINVGYEASNATRRWT